MSCDECKRLREALEQQRTWARMAVSALRDPYLESRASLLTVALQSLEHAIAALASQPESKGPPAPAPVEERCSRCNGSGEIQRLPKLHEKTGHYYTKPCPGCTGKRAKPENANTPPSGEE